MCVAGVCDGDHVVTTTSTTIDCTPYKCAATAACLTTCTTDADCASPNVCDPNGACVSQVVQASGGCGCTTGDRGGGEGWLLAGIVALTAAGRRRRVVRSVRMR
jgi:MYXO-CTERM domain-containing protein